MLTMAERAGPGTLAPDPFRSLLTGLPPAFTRGGFPVGAAPGTVFAQRVSHGVGIEPELGQQGVARRGDQVVVGLQSEHGLVS